MDLQESTRRDDSYAALTSLIQGLKNVNAFPPLVWLWTWDCVVDRLKVYAPGADESYVTNTELSEKDVFDMFWEDADKNGFTLEYGLEALDDAILDWLVDRRIIIDLDEISSAP